MRLLGVCRQRCWSCGRVPLQAMAAAKSKGASKASKASVSQVLLCDEAFAPGHYTQNSELPGGEERGRHWACGYRNMQVRQMRQTRQMRRVRRVRSARRDSWRLRPRGCSHILLASAASGALFVSQMMCSALLTVDTSAVRPPGPHGGGQSGQLRRALFGGCGFVPKVQGMQLWLQRAWAEGFDSRGAQEMGQVAGTQKWVGTAECCVLLRSFGVRANIKARASCCAIISPLRHHSHATRWEGACHVGARAEGYVGDPRCLSMYRSPSRRGTSKRNQSQSGWWSGCGRCVPMLETPLIQKRSAALNPRNWQLSFGYVLQPSLLRTMSKGERQTRPNDAHSSL